MRKYLALFVAALTAGAAIAADDLPIFNGTLTVGRESRFVLVTPAGKSSAWLRVGDAFEGYTVKAYDAKATALDLEHGGKIVRVTLVADAATANAPAVTPATLADAAAVLNKMHFDEVMERTLERQKKTITASLDQSLSRLGGMPGVNQDDFRDFKKKIGDEVGSIMNPQQLKTDMTQIYSDVFSKEELDGISAFYSTPLGEAMTAKLPEVQDRIGAIFQARIADMMPQIQQMSRDFVAGQKAKQAGAGAAPSPAPAGNP